MNVATANVKILPPRIFCQHDSCVENLIQGEVFKKFKRKYQIPKLPALQYSSSVFISCTVVYMIYCVAYNFIFRHSILLIF